MQCSERRPKVSLALPSTTALVDYNRDGRDDLMIPAHAGGAVQSGRNITGEWVVLVSTDEGFSVYRTSRPAYIGGWDTSEPFSEAANGGLQRRWRA